VSERGDLTVTRQADWYQELRRKHERDPKYWVEYLKLVFSEDVGWLMDERGVNQADLARDLDVSRAYVTRLFHGTFNPTVETLVKVALALDARVALHLHPRHTDTCWLEVPVVMTTPEAEVWAGGYKELVSMPASCEVRRETTSTVAA
jgi:transcriptional regulator with XRE-family HTH domain